MFNLAFFDVDGPLRKGYVIQEFALFLTKEGKFKNQYASEITQTVEAYKKGKLDYIEASHKIPKFFAAGLNKQLVTEIIDLAGSFMEYLVEGYFAYTRDLICLVKEMGFRTVLVSGSPLIVIELMKKDLEADACIGFMPKHYRGKFTGKVALDAVDQNVKATLIGTCAKVAGVNLLNCVSCGDSKGDLRMLELTGKPIALNPDPEFTKIAKQRNWPIIKPADNVLEKVAKLLEKKTSWNKPKKD